MSVERREVSRMERDLGIQWRQESPYLHAAYVTTSRGRKVYVGYVATGPGDDAWRGYMGVSFTPVGRGPRGVVQAAVEQRGREILAQWEKGVSPHAS